MIEKTMTVTEAKIAREHKWSLSRSMVSACFSKDAADSAAHLAFEAADRESSLALSAARTAAVRDFAAALPEPIFRSAVIGLTRLSLSTAVTARRTLE